MIIADTSVWIEFLKGNEELSDPFVSYLSKGDIIGVSAVFGELLQGVKNKRERKLIVEFWENLPKADEVDSFIAAGILSEKHRLHSQGVGLIDCYIMTAAIQNDLAIWTLDKKLNKAMDIVTV